MSNNTDYRNENIAKSAFSNNNQGEQNNENNKLNQKNKSQEEFEPVEKDKEEKEEKSCFKSITSILETRQVSPFALTVFTIIGILINVIVFVSSLIYSSIDLNPKTPYFLGIRTYF